MKLRELTPADAPRCAELEKVLFPGETPWSSGVFHQEMAQPFNFYFGVEGALDPAHESTVLLGYAGIGMMGPALIQNLKSTPSASIPPHSAAASLA